ncbi:MAG: DUF4147 domain-containing protein [Planctomycetota bacterium]
MTRRIEAPVLGGLDPGFVGSVVSVALDAADPSNAVERAWPRVAPWAEDLPGLLSIVSVGKAAPGMMTAALSCADEARSITLGPCVAVAPHGTRLGAEPDRRVEWLRGTHPIADEATVRSAERVAALAHPLGADDGLLLLIGGGGSALSTLPVDGVALSDLLGVTEGLLRAGATIRELNAVRGSCERLKAGGLAGLGAPASVRSMLISDVIGDDPAVIASGLGMLGAGDDARAEEARRALERYGLRGRFETIDTLLAALPNPPTNTTDRSDDAEPVIMTSNRLATDAVEGLLIARGFEIAERRDGVGGEASTIAGELVAAGRAHAGGMRAVVWGGETTVTVGDAAGRGGRNLELALAAAAQLRPGECLISLATDGVDGLSDGAGAAVDGATLARLDAARIDAEQALRTHDSHNALDAAGAIIRTGPTGTNVMDVMLYLAV